MINRLKKIGSSIITLFVIEPQYILLNNENGRVSSIINENAYDLIPINTKYFEVSIHSEKWINIEFFEESSSMVDIKIKGDNKKVKYSLSIFTVPTLHIVVDIADWSPGCYQIQIKNKQGKFRTCFIL